jgi:acid phosphatase (class A)
MLTGKTAIAASMVLAAALAAGCAAVVAPTSPADLPQVRPNYVIGYLAPEQLPDSRALLPPPPAAGSVAFAADEDAYRSTRKLRGTPRWTLAAKDRAHVSERPRPSPARWPCPYRGSHAAPEHLLRRVRADASRANDKPKEGYKRRRPYVAHGDASCTPHEKHKDDSYPSGHASIGWAWALALAEIAPERADAVLARGFAYGQSRVVCGVHWHSDVEAGRVVGASTVSRLHADPVFMAQMAGARKEIAAARAANLKSLLDCAAEAQALARGQ